MVFGCEVFSLFKTFEKSSFSRPTGVRGTFLIFFVNRSVRGHASHEGYRRAIKVFALLRENRYINIDTNREKQRVNGNKLEW